MHRACEMGVEPMVAQKCGARVEARMGRARGKSQREGQETL